MTTLLPLLRRRRPQPAGGLRALQPWQGVSARARGTATTATMAAAAAVAGASVRGSPLAAEMDTVLPPSALERWLKTLRLQRETNSVLGGMLPVAPRLHNAERDEPRQVSGAAFAEVVTPLPELKDPVLVCLSESALAEALDWPAWTTTTTRTTPPPPPTTTGEARNVDAPVASAYRYRGGKGEEALARLLAGNELLQGSVPYAHCYAGYQFGSYAGQLGDGAAVYLGEWENVRGDRWEMQVKGIGKTPFSRTADGRKVLRSSTREFLASEAMHALGISTTRAGALVTSDSVVLRDPHYDGNTTWEKASTVLRLAPTFLRFGSFETTLSQHGSPNPQGDETLLRAVADHAMRTVYPHLGDNDYRAMLREVAARTGKLVAQWTAVGFCHGVLNTDNMSIAGLTIDYGPYGFQEYWDTSYVSNGSDSTARYAFDSQPAVCLWNLFKLCEAFAPLLRDSGTEEGGSEVEAEAEAEVEKAYRSAYQNHFMREMREKLGLLDVADTGAVSGLYSRLLGNAPSHAVALTRHKDKLKDMSWRLRWLLDGPYSGPQHASEAAAGGGSHTGGDDAAILDRIDDRGPNNVGGGGAGARPGRRALRPRSLAHAHPDMHFLDVLSEVPSSSSTVPASAASPSVEDLTDQLLFAELFSTLQATHADYTVTMLSLSQLAAGRSERQEVLQCIAAACASPEEVIAGLRRKLQIASKLNMAPQTILQLWQLVRGDDSQRAQLVQVFKGAPLERIMQSVAGERHKLDLAVRYSSAVTALEQDVKKRAPSGGDTGAEAAAGADAASRAKAAHDMSMWEEFLTKFEARLDAQAAATQQQSQHRAATAGKAPVQFILRNWAMHDAVDAAENNGDFSKIRGLLQLATHPFEDPRSVLAGGRVEEGTEDRDLLRYCAGAPLWGSSLICTCSS